MMDKRKMKSFIEMVNTLRDSLTDEQAADVLELFPTWKEGKEYRAGERVRHGDKLYKSEGIRSTETPDRSLYYSAINKRKPNKSLWED